MIYSPVYSQFIQLPLAVLLGNVLIGQSMHSIFGFFRRYLLLASVLTVYRLIRRFSAQICATYGAHAHLILARRRGVGISALRDAEQNPFKKHEKY